MWQNILVSMSEEELCHLLHTSAPVTSLDRYTSVDSNLPGMGHEEPDNYK